MSEENKRKPRDGSGKTRFNREKRKGESWTDLRAKAITAGTFKPRPR